MRRTGLLLALLAAPACATEPIRPVIPADLAGDWRLVVLPASFGPELVSRASMRIGSDGQILGASGCNTIYAWLEIHPPAEYATGLSATGMVCDGEIMSVEYLFLKALAEAEEYIATPDSLILRARQGEPLAYFQRYTPD